MTWNVGTCDIKISSSKPSASPAAFLLLVAINLPVMQPGTRTLITFIIQATTALGSVNNPSEAVLTPVSRSAQDLRVTRMGMSTARWERMSPSDVFSLRPKNLLPLPPIL